MIGICDVNNFYASAERLFRPDLNGKPIICLSNNDGAVVARSAESKNLGIKMGEPAFKIQDLIKKHNIHCFSSNYALYADISSRVMTTLESLVPKVEIYSCDEAWLLLDGTERLMSSDAYGRHIRKTVLKHTGLTCGIGISTSKTLAKAFNWASKKFPGTQGVVALTEPSRIRRLLSLMPLEEVWGCGRQTTKKCQVMGITTALQLADADTRLIRKTFGVVLERTVRELRGESCIALEENPPTKQQIIVSRSFGERVTTLEQMRQAVNAYAERAAEKLRGEKQYCRQVSVFLRTSPYAVQDPFYGNNSTQATLTPTQDTRDIIQLAQRGLETIWRDGYRYQKAGIMLSDFYDTGIAQIDFFDELQPRNGSEALMATLDKINTSGLGKVYFAGQGIVKPWGMKREMLSPAYTTRWNCLPTATIG
ncbi:translesion error-prone DNA polymerase V subunit UmuC [Serratia ficaria]|uniref:translesion error-prone DNA polymerase V subunit UmuC n=1 Tax=Serratia ficaria TaxID=61651 RepID=UPI0021C970DB|nr:translesion error-prone DNA polymerase V subunit UmuC [Serratia ficaria]